MTEKPLRYRTIADLIDCGEPESTQVVTRAVLEARVAAPTPHADLVRRLTEWLAMGGFFNPGPMARANEDATRELILDVREALSRVAAPTAVLAAPPRT